MSQTGHQRHFSAGSVLFREGDDSRHMYVIVSGKVRISRRVRGVDKVITTLPSGEFFGEMATLNDEPRSATATVVEDAHLLEVGPEDFDGLLHHHREVGIRLVRRLAARLATANRDITLLMYRDPLSRVAHALHTLGRLDGHRVGAGLEVPVGQMDLAQRLGLTGDELSEVMTGLTARGIVQQADEQKVVVADAHRLVRLVEYLDLHHEFGDLRS